MVKVIEIDNLGRINLSRRAVLEGEGGDDIEDQPGEIPSPLTRRTSTLQATGRPMQPRPPRQNGGGGAGGGFNRNRGRPRGPGGPGGPGQGGPRPPRPMGR
jgi:hypothetical protein